MGRGQAFETRVHQFRTVYCDLSDNNASLKYMCEHDQSGDGTPPTGAKDWKRVNKDIDFQRTLDSVNTIEVNYADSKATDIEEDIVALAKNLYWPVTYERPDPDTLPQHKYDIMDARRVTALYSIAHNSFAHYVGLKSEANSAPKKDKFVPGWAYMNTMLREFNISDEEITNIMGENPSYYAQMDFLTKKLYQIPDFYTNLYDTPTNVDRILVSMDAISLMQQRDHYESMLRHEMLSSALLQTELVPRMERVQALLGQTVE